MLLGLWQEYPPVPGWTPVNATVASLICYPVTPALQESVPSQPPPALFHGWSPSAGTPRDVAAGPNALLCESLPELIISLALRQAPYLKRFLHIKN